jgi:hypothetical protein
MTGGAVSVCDTMQGGQVPRRRGFSLIIGSLLLVDEWVRWEASRKMEKRTMGIIRVRRNTLMGRR